VSNVATSITGHAWMALVLAIPPEMLAGADDIIE
jgi:hypothetical protein